MSNVDLNASIRGLVSGEVEKILLPYRQILERMAQFMGEKPAKRGPGRPPKAAVAAGGKKHRRKGRKARKAGKGDVSKFREGQTVHYKQGRGEFEASVVAIDLAAGSLLLERAKDGKKVNRPAAKVYAA